MIAKTFDRIVTGALVGMVLSTLFLEGSALPSASAQTLATQLNPSARVARLWGDPYRSSVNPGVAANYVVPVVADFSEMDPYAAPPVTAELNAPIVAVPTPIPDPMVGGSTVQYGSVSQGRFGNFFPLFPRLRQQLDTTLYLRADYLHWDVSGMRTPALVTTSAAGTPQPQAGVLGQPNTSILFGGNKLNDSSTGGYLISGGLWILPAKTFALEGEYFALGELDDGYFGSSNGDVILARPYFDISSGNESAQLLAFPNRSSGNVQVTSESNLRSYLLNGRFSLCSHHGICCQQCGQRNRTDWILGYRNIRLRDQLRITDNRMDLSTASPQSFSSADQFQTTNQFGGLQLGVVHRKLMRKAWLESTLRVAIGNNEQRLQISGSTTRDQSGVVDTFDGGLLAQSSNSGTFTRDEFMMVPEAGIRLGFRLTDCLHASLGYTVLYLPNVIRASEQIDSDVNPALIPPGTNPVTGALRPRVQWIQTDYLAHGLHFGGELHF